MSNSFFQSLPLTCPRCGAAFQAELWLIVDAAERPDLLERAKQGTLHEIACPQCGPIGQTDAPLLLYFPPDFPSPPGRGDRGEGQPPSPPGRGAGGEGPGVRVLFSPAQATTAEQDAEHARDLLARLKASLGPAWRDDWLANGLPAVPRALLPLALTEGLEAAQRKMQEDEQAPEEAIRLLEDAGELGKALIGVLSVRSAEEHRAFLEQHPELYAPKGLQLLERLLAAETRPQARQQLEMFLQIHRRCQEEGLEQTFAELNQAAGLPPEVREVLEEIARRGVEIRTPEDLERILEENPDLREKLERAARNRQGGLEIPHEFHQDIQLAQEALQTYLRTGRLEALNQAASAWQRILGHPAFGAVPERFRLAVLNEAGGVFLRRYWRAGALPDLELALHCWQQALAATPPDSPDRPGYLNNLGTGLSDRYGRTGRLEHLEEAIRVYREALAATPPDSPDRPSILNNLGTGLSDRYGRTGQLEDLEEARNFYRQACNLAEVCSQDVLLTASRAWGGWAFERRAWEEAAEAYLFSFLAIERLFRAQFSRAEKESWIREIQGLPARAAYALLQIGRPERALEVLEGGRARLLGEALEHSRRDLEHLASLGHEDLLKRYREASARYEALSRPADGTERSATAPSRPADWLQQMEAVQAELDAVIEQIRQVPGYETFLRTLTAGQIQSLAEDAPLVYLAATPAGGLALIVQAAGVKVLELPELTEEALREQVVGPKDDPAIGGYLGAYWGWLANPKDETARQAWFEALEAMLGWLGQAVMGPLLARLEALGVPQGSVVRLIPGGWLGLLPLHAALTPGPSPAGRGEYALDQYTFTYLPSAQALYYARQQASRPAETLLLVDNPDETLVFSGQEARGVQDVFAKQATTTLKGARATKERVSQAMKAAGVLHFSTHGRAGWTESERAGVLMAGGEWLTLPEIFDLRLEASRLAMLSACETGVPGLKNPDEVEALPSGLMLAGVPGVVGSLWAVNDLSTALLMTWFYHFWRKEGMELPQALSRAQRYLRDVSQSETRRAELESLAARAGWRMSAEQAGDFLTLVSLRNFAHPYYWAGFTFTGV